MPVHSVSTRPPLVRVGLSVDNSHLSRGLGGPPAVATALVDTGASLTAVDPTLIAALQPLQIGMSTYAVPGGGTATKPTYLIRLAFEPDVQQPRWWTLGRWFNVEVVEASPASEGVDVLVGRDLLDQLVLTWDGPRPRLLLMY